MTFCYRAGAAGSLPTAHRKPKSEATGFPREKGLFVRQSEKETGDKTQISLPHLGGKSAFKEREIASPAKCCFVNF